MAEPTDPEPAQAPEPQPWKRKHGPEPPAVADKPSPNTAILKVLLGGIISIGLSIVGWVGALDKRQEDAPVPPPAAYDLEAAKSLQRVLDRARPPAINLEEIERQVAGLEPRLEAVEKAVTRVRSLPNGNAKVPEDPETVQMYATLRRALGDMQTQLATLEPSRLSPDELAKRDQLAQRVENLRCTLVVITERDN